MPSDPWGEFEEVSPAPRGGGADPWAGFEEVPTAGADPWAASDRESFGLRKAESIGPTPWYSRGIFGGGRGPSVRDALSVLPMVGGTIGGIVGGGGGSIPGAVAGATLGGSGGEAMRQNIERAIGVKAVPQTGLEAAEGIATEGAIQGGAEGLGRGVGKLIAPAATRTLAPFAGEVDKPATEAARRLGVDLPAAARSTSNVVPNLEATAAKGVGGRTVGERYVKAANSLTAMADHTVARASKLADDSQRGKAIADGLDSFRKNWIRQKNSLYAEAALPEKGIAVEAKDTVALLDEIVRAKRSAGSVLQGGPAADVKFYEGIFDGLTTFVKGPGGQEVRVLRAVEAKDLLNARRELNQKIKGSFADPFAAANKGTLRKVSAALDRELTQAIERADPKLAAKLAKANAAYADGLGKINSTFGKTIHKLAREGKYDKIAQSVANSRVSVDDIPRIMEVAGPEGTEAMQAAVVASLVSKAKNTSGQLTPDGLGRAMKNFGEDRLEATLLPDQYARLRDIATASRSLAKGEKVMHGSQTAFNWQTANPAGLAWQVLGAPARRFLGSESGQRWLTTGWQPVSREAIEAGARRTARGATYLGAGAEDE